MPDTQRGKEEKKPTLSSKVANMANSDANNELAAMLATQMIKQGVNLREDTASLIQSSLAPIRSALTSFQGKNELLVMAASDMCDTCLTAQAVRSCW